MSIQLKDLFKNKVFHVKSILSNSYFKDFENIIHNDIGEKIRIKTSDELINYSTQYSITLSNDDSIDIFLDKFPFELPYSQVVIKFNEMYKKYIKEIYSFLEPLYSDVTIELFSAANDFLKKQIQAFLFYADFLEKTVNILRSGLMGNNVIYCLRSTQFYEDYLRKKLSTDENFKFNLEREYLEVASCFEDLIYEKMKQKMKDFIYDLMNNTSILTKIKNGSSEMDDIINYLHIFN